MQRLILAIHNHQPVGNFDHVLKDAYDRCYRPFLDLCGAHPGVKLALHYSGPLLEWIEAHAPTFLVDVRALVARGQVEILGGGFYEPMLAVLPDGDARGQILRMQDFCEAHFGARPTGMWLAERVWDPDLPRVISPTGTRYTLLDDAHFFAAGVQKGQLSGYYVTEKAGETLSIFPIDQQLRYAIPWKTIPDLERHLRDLEGTRGDDAQPLTYGDDGEKFGLWPRTWDWVFGPQGKGGWLRDFFRFLEDRTDLVTTVLPRDTLARTPPNDRIYLPTASYEEMGEWSLPTKSIRSFTELRERLKHDGVYERYQPFVRGGIWQGFFTKYPESNYLHKRVLHVSARLRSAEARLKSPQAEALLTEAKEHLYRSECNCAYWHGLFGGLYLNNLRHAVAEALLRAERLVDQAERGDRPFLAIATYDLDADLSSEVVVRSDRLSVVVSPREGGSLLELADLTRAFLLSDVLTRREEGYHDKLRAIEAAGDGDHTSSTPTNAHDLVQSKEKNLTRFLVFDRDRRTSFRDRLYAPDAKLETLTSGESGDLGTFATAHYRLTAPSDDLDAAAYELTLSADGELRLLEGIRPLRVQKRYAFARGESGFDVRYRLENIGPHPLKSIFAPELNLTLLTGDAADRLLELPEGRSERLGFRGELANLTGFGLFDGWAKLRLALRATIPFNLWTYPVEAVSQSEAGFERNYQGSCFLLCTPLELAPGATAELAFHLELEHPA